MNFLKTSAAIAIFATRIFATESIAIKDASSAVFDPYSGFTFVADGTANLRAISQFNTKEVLSVALANPVDSVFFNGDQVIALAVADGKLEVSLVDPGMLTVTSQFSVPSVIEARGFELINGDLVFVLGQHGGQVVSLSQKAVVVGWAEWAARWVVAVAVARWAEWPGCRADSVAAWAADLAAVSR